MIAASLVVRADVVWAGSGVASNPTPVLQASMQLVSQEGQCFTWQVTGKVKPAFRGFNSEVRLVCGTPDALANVTAPIDGSKMPQACGKQLPPEDLPSDPNGSQPCGGDDTLCPSR